MSSLPEMILLGMLGFGMVGWGLFQAVWLWRLLSRS
jgi:hypothetical protein